MRIRTFLRRKWRKLQSLLAQLRESVQRWTLLQSREPLGEPPRPPLMTCRAGEGMIAMGSDEGRVRLVEAATGMTRWAERKQPFVTREVTVVISPDGRFLASVAVSEQNWKLWDAARGVVCVTGARHDGTGVCACRANRSGLRKKMDEGCPLRRSASTTLHREEVLCRQRCKKKSVLD